MNDLFTNIFRIISQRSGSTKMPEITSDDEIWNLIMRGLWNLLVLVLIFMVLILVYQRLNSKTRKKLWHFIDSKIKWYIIAVWVMGFVTYFTGQYVGIAGTMFHTVPMAIIHSTGMFIGLSDISAIREPQHNNALFMAFFDMSHILAIFGSMVFVMRQFGYFLGSSCKIYYESHIRRRKRDKLFVFWGLNDASFYLAQSIQKECRNESYRIVFVRTFDDSDKESEQFHFGQIFDKIKTKHQDLDRLRELGCYSTASFHRITHVDGRENDSILDTKMGLRSLSKLMQKDRTVGQTYFFFLGENQEDNLTATSILMKDRDVKSNKVGIYCHAHRDLCTEWMEFYDISHLEDDTEIRLVDSSMLSVAELRSDVTKQPVSYVRINPDATVDDKFEALIIGFGETGQEAFKYLYEFSAFCGPDKKRSPFAIHVVDRNMDELKGDFNLQYPALSGYVLKDGENSNDKKYSIDLKQQSVFDSEFWFDLKNYVSSLRYVVIAIDNEEQEIELAAKIYQMAIHENGAINGPFNIFIKCNSRYNACSFENTLEFVNNVNKTSRPTIATFGAGKDIFSYGIVVCDKLHEEAVTFYDSYRSLSQEGDPDWMKRRSKVKNGDYFDMSNLKRKEYQDKANALHVQTKMEIFRVAAELSNLPFNGDKNDFEKLAGMNCSGDMKAADDISCVRYEAPAGYDAEVLNEIITNLAVTEHLRWTASHELLGYVVDNKATGANHRKKTHNCMVDWDQLQEVTTRSWEDSWHTDYLFADYKVVITSFKVESNNKS